MEQVLWEPSDYHYNSSNMSRYISFVNKTYNQSFQNYDTLYDWSISNTEDFWASVAAFCNINFSKKYTSVMKVGDSFIDCNWFDGAKLNFAENLLQYRDNKVAIEYFCENKIKGSITYKELFDEVKNAGSASFDEIWGSIDGTVGYHTSSIIIKSPFRTSFDGSQKRLLLSMVNLQSSYRQDDYVKLRIFIEDSIKFNYTNDDWYILPNFSSKVL